MRKLKKKNFVLFELLIAFTLVSMTILPFIRFPYSQMQKEIDLLFEMKLEQVAIEALSDFQVAIFQKKVDPKLLFGDEKQAREPYQISEIEVSLFPKRKRKYEKKIFVFWEKRKKLPEGGILSLCSIRVQIFHPKDLNSPVVSAKTHFLAEKSKS